MEGRRADKSAWESSTSDRMRNLAPAAASRISTSLKIWFNIFILYIRSVLRTLKRLGCSLASFLAWAAMDEVGGAYEALSLAPIPSLCRSLGEQ